MTLLNGGAKPEKPLEANTTAKTQQLLVQYPQHTSQGGDRIKFYQYAKTKA